VKKNFNFDMGVSYIEISSILVVDVGDSLQIRAYFIISDAIEKIRNVVKSNVGALGVFYTGDFSPYFFIGSLPTHSDVNTGEIIRAAFYLQAYAVEIQMLDYSFFEDLLPLYRLGDNNVSLAASSSSTSSFDDHTQFMLAREIEEERITLSAGR